MTVILESKLMVDVDQEMFMEGHAITTKNLDGKMTPELRPSASMRPGMELDG